MSNAVMRMSSLGGAMILQKMGLETVLQACCRDRNRIALQADLLAGHACGIRNVMAVTGQGVCIQSLPPEFGDSQNWYLHELKLYLKKYYYDLQVY